MATPSKLNLDELATSIVKCFPSFNLLEQRLSLELYRLLAEGQPVPRTVLAKQLEISIETVNRILDGWPGVFSDGEQRIVGYWGLSIPAAYRSVTAECSTVELPGNRATRLFSFYYKKQNPL